MGEDILTDGLAQQCRRLQEEIAELKKVHHGEAVHLYAAIDTLTAEKAAALLRVARLEETLRTAGNVK
jgi:hypothetical protein